MSYDIIVPSISANRTQICLLWSLKQDASRFSLKKMCRRWPQNGLKDFRHFEEDFDKYRSIQYAAINGGNPEAVFISPIGQSAKYWYRAMVCDGVENPSTVTSPRIEALEREERAQLRDEALMHVMERARNEELLAQARRDTITDGNPCEPLVSKYCCNLACEMFDNKHWLAAAMKRRLTQLNQHQLVCAVKHNALPQWNINSNYN